MRETDAQWPWRPRCDSAKQNLPTLVWCEKAFRVMALTTLAHAKTTGNLPLWFSGLACGLMNDVGMKMNPVFIDSMWQAQASVMLTPRLPLHVLEMYASVIYASTVAARKFRLPYIAESIVCGLFGHLAFHCYDINGPRFLWWTYHDSNPYLQVRNLTSPAMASVWTLTFGAIHCILFRWINDAQLNTAQKAAAFIFEIPQAGIRKLLEPWLKVLDWFDGLHRGLNRLPVMLKILFCGTVISPLFQLTATIFHLLSLDKLGVPGNRTYRLVVLSYFVFLARERKIRPGAFSLKSTEKTVREKVADASLFFVMAGYFAIQVIIRGFGDPSKHVSTGCHQRCTNLRTRSKDVFGRSRTNEIRLSGPTENSRWDYRVASADDGPLDPSGQPIIVPSDSNERSNSWYTIFGIDDPQNRRKELAVVSFFALLGVGSFGKALLIGQPLFPKCSK